jgi:hypothetical protein
MAGITPEELVRGNDGVNSLVSVRNWGVAASEFLSLICPWLSRAECGYSISLWKKGC